VSGFEFIVAFLNGMHNHAARPMNHIDRNSIDAAALMIGLCRSSFKKKAWIVWSVHRRLDWKMQKQPRMTQTFSGPDRLGIRSSHRVSQSMGKVGGNIPGAAAFQDLRFDGSCG
jgi:hypothetical protein